MAMYRELTPEELTWRLDEEKFSFNTTSEVVPVEGTIGQERALKALDFGLGIKSFGYNLYVMGQPGTGRSATVTKVLEQKAKDNPPPMDWVYLMDFKKPDRPSIVGLPRGKGCELQVDMDSLIEQLKKAIPKAFEGEDFEKRREELVAEHNKQTGMAMEELDKDALNKGFAVERSQRGIFLVPRKQDGRLMSQEEFEVQDPNVKQKIEEQGNVLQSKLADVMRRVREVEKGLGENLKDLNREFGMYAVGQLITELREKYREFPKILTYLDEVNENILEHLDDFRPAEQAPPIPFVQRQEPSFERYKVNLLVNNCTVGGAPVVYEPNPTYPNLFGHIDQKVQYGFATTDFTLIKPGALHRANGGYLVVEAMDLLRNPFAYDGLKRALKNKTVAIEDVLEPYRLMTFQTLKPEPAPLDVKVVLIGPPMVYYMLYSLDEEYRKLFKVHADFDSRISRSPEAVDSFAGFIAAKAKEEGLLPFSRSGVSRIIEHAARLVSDKEKLSLKFLDVLDTLREASYWAAKENSGAVDREHVEKAVEENTYRSNMLEEKIREAIQEGVIYVDIESSVVGQVNGLSVIGLGGYSFGRPSRITATTFMGKGMVNIEREVKMSGPIHDKGVLILTGYLGDKFAHDKPLAFSASIAFEQSYEGIEGDSASSTELYALISSLSGLPIKQGIAVTGSVNQRGEVQPIGGVNEKVEGFFEVCKQKGLTGEQGVMVPESNVRHLMLKDEVVRAVREGRFHIWSVKDIDAGIEVLTGVPAGKRQPDGSYPEGTVNQMVDQRLIKFAKEMKDFGEPAKEGADIKKAA